MLNSLWKYVWNPEADHEQNNTDKSSNENAQKTGENGETKRFSGKVTAVHSGYGMIDNEVYFNLDCVSGRVPQVGDDVDVTAHRKHPMGGWRAKQVVLYEKEIDPVWDFSDTETCKDMKLKDNCRVESKEKPSVANPAQMKATVGMVTEFSREDGIISDNYQFKLVDCIQGYLPMKGDWVSVNLVSDSFTGHTFAKDIKPLRETTFEGKINSCQTGFGYINGDIYFTFNVCEEGYNPRRGDRVCGQAVESSRALRNPWRALSVCPVQRNLKDKYISPAVLQSPLQVKGLSELLSDKQGIEVTSTIDFGSLHLGTEKTFAVWLRNRGSDTTILKSALIRGSRSQFSFSSDTSTFEIDYNCLLLPKMTTKVMVYCKPSNLGIETQMLILQFKDFQIGREMRVNVSDSDQAILLEGSRKYEKRMGWSRYRAAQETNTDSWIVPGQRPQNCRPNLQLPNRLPQYPIPSQLRECYLNNDNLVNLVPELSEELNLKGYAKKFNNLLHLEEIQEEVDIRDFDMERVCLKPIGDYLSLQVPGLSEGRPSVLIGDRVILTEPFMPEQSPEYEGYVHEITRDEVWLKFNQTFHTSYGGQDYNVRFTFNRTTLRRSHQAAEFALELGAQVLFPESLIPKMPQTKGKKSTDKLLSSPLTKQGAASIGIKRGPPIQRRISDSMDSLNLVNKQLNVRQRAAVSRILHGQSRPTPYILFGPPGTGKTVTLVESILQVFIQLLDSRILACAPSNSASDLLAERLHESGKVQQGDMARLNAFQRGEESVPEAVKPYVCNGDNLELVSRYRIIICTCASAGMMYSLGLKLGHFTHVFVDECGQATEPECMIPVGLVAGSQGQVVLAGDPKQLGPVLRSSEAKEYGLSQSLLERMMNLPIYARDEKKFSDHGSYDPLLVTKLVQNYRSHSALIDLPSQLFYDKELVVSAEKQMVECLCNWEMLPNKLGFPFIFHGMRGEDLREGNSPSWFNPVEAVQVMKYLQALVNNQVHQLTFDDIGIITPYRKQVEKIRLLIDRLGMDSVKVGSVEEFQGQERLVIIISTVRANEGHVGIDLLHNLGFLSNEKRFNVAITRAQALLIVVGNPHVLYRDPMWNKLICYAVKNNAYIGCDLPSIVIEEKSGQTIKQKELSESTQQTKNEQMEADKTQQKESEGTNKIKNKQREIEKTQQQETESTKQIKYEQMKIEKTKQKESESIKQIKNELMEIEKTHQKESESTKLMKNEQMEIEKTQKKSENAKQMKNEQMEIEKTQHKESEITEQMKTEHTEIHRVEHSLNVKKEMGKIIEQNKTVKSKQHEQNQFRKEERKEVERKEETKVQNTEEQQKDDLIGEDISESEQYTDNYNVATPTICTEVLRSPPTALESKIIRQMEYYFGTVNLFKDKFLQEKMSSNEGNWVDLEIIITFNKMKLLTRSFEQICTALNKSSSGIIEVNSDHKRVRRHPSMPLIKDHEQWRRQLYYKAVVLGGLNIQETSAMDRLQNYLEERFGTIEHIERGIPKVKEENEDYLQLQMIIFCNRSSVMNFPDTLSVEGRDLKVYKADPYVEECVLFFYNKRVKLFNRYRLKPIGHQYYKKKSSSGSFTRHNSTQQQQKQQNTKEWINKVCDTIQWKRSSEHDTNSHRYNVAGAKRSNEHDTNSHRDNVAGAKRSSEHDTCSHRDNVASASTQSVLPGMSDKLPQNYSKNQVKNVPHMATNNVKKSTEGPPQIPMNRTEKSPGTVDELSLNGTKQFSSSAYKFESSCKNDSLDTSEHKLLKYLNNDNIMYKRKQEESPPVQECEDKVETLYGETLLGDDKQVPGNQRAKLWLQAHGLLSPSPTENVEAFSGTPVQQAEETPLIMPSPIKGSRVADKPAVINKTTEPLARSSTPLKRPSKGNGSPSAFMGIGRGYRTLQQLGHTPPKNVSPPLINIINEETESENTSGELSGVFQRMIHNDLCASSDNKITLSGAASCSDRQETSCQFEDIIQSSSFTEQCVDDFVRSRTNKAGSSKSDNNDKPVSPVHVVDHSDLMNVKLNSNAETAIDLNQDRSSECKVTTSEITGMLERTFLNDKVTAKMDEDSGVSKDKHLDEDNTCDKYKPVEISHIVKESHNVELTHGDTQYIINVKSNNLIDETGANLLEKMLHLEKSNKEDFERNIHTLGEGVDDKPTVISTNRKVDKQLGAVCSGESSASVVVDAPNIIDTCSGLISNSSIEVKSVNLLQPFKDINGSPDSNNISEGVSSFKPKTYNSIGLCLDDTSVKMSPQSKNTTEQKLINPKRVSTDYSGLCTNYVASKPELTEEYSSQGPNHTSQQEMSVKPKTYSAMYNCLESDYSEIVVKPKHSQNYHQQFSNDSNDSINSISKYYYADLEQSDGDVIIEEESSDSEDEQQQLCVKDHAIDDDKQTESKKTMINNVDGGDEIWT